MRTTLTLSDDIFQAAKTLAQSSGKSLGVVISELVRRALKSDRSHGKEKGLPVFSVSSGADLIPGNRASELLDRDDPIG